MRLEGFCFHLILPKPNTLVLWREEVSFCILCRMLRFFARLLWALIAIAAAFAMATIARSRGEPVNSMWLVIAAVCTYLVGYRFTPGFWRPA